MSIKRTSLNERVFLWNKPLNRLVWNTTNTINIYQYNSINIYAELPCPFKIKVEYLINNEWKPLLEELKSGNIDLTMKIDNSSRLRLSIMPLSNNNDPVILCTVNGVIA